MRFPLLALFCLSFIGFSQNKSVLFIGNSYTAANGLPLLVYNLAEANEDTIDFDASAPGGSQFYSHKTNPTTLEKISSQVWDFVVLQDQSQIPALPEEIVEEYYSPPNATALVDSIKSNDPCTEVVFYLTWGRKAGDASYCAEYPPVCTFEGMQDELTSTYVAMANENDAIVAPAGEAWRAAINEDPDLELYVGDGSHPNIAGSYLTACVIYATIYQKPTVGNTYTAGIEPEIATFLQEKADEIVFGMIDTWRIGDNDLVADFSYEAASLVYNFSNNSTNDLSWEWLIDGEVYLFSNPTHTFEGIGEYEATLTVYNDCDTASITQMITIEADDLDIATSDIEETAIYPNPANDLLIIRTKLNEGSTYTIYNLQGELLINGNLNTGVKIDIAQLSTGSYLIEIDGSVYRFTKSSY